MNQKLVDPPRPSAGLSTKNGRCGPEIQTLGSIFAPLAGPSAGFAVSILSFDGRAVFSTFVRVRRAGKRGSKLDIFGRGEIPGFSGRRCCLKMAGHIPAAAGGGEGGFGEGAKPVRGDGGRRRRRKGASIYQHLSIYLSHNLSSSHLSVSISRTAQHL